MAYNFTTCITAFCLLGIGNTILQVSLNPLLTNVVKGDALTSSLWLLAMPIQEKAPERTALAAMIALYFMRTEVSILAVVGAIGFACSSLFSVLFSQAIQARPQKANEISGLMITGGDLYAYALNRIDTN